MIVAATPTELDSLRLRNEFLEMPGLTISVPQVARPAVGARGRHSRDACPREVPGADTDRVVSPRRGDSTRSVFAIRRLRALLTVASTIVRRRGALLRHVVH
jgi:hypothetical protein